MPRGSGVFFVFMDTETSTKILFPDLNWGTFYSLPKGTQILLSDGWEKSIKAMCRSRSWLLCFSCHFLPLAHGECWVSSGEVPSKPGRCCDPPVLPSLLCLLAMGMGWDQLVDKDLVAASILLRAGRMGWLFCGIAVLLHCVRPNSPLVHSMSMELIPTYSDAGKLWPLQLISNCNPNRRMVG